MDQKKVKIGIVEDQAEFRSHVEESLKEVLPAENVFSWNSAEEFLRDPEGDGLNLMFVDIMLPHMDGVHLTPKILERNPETKIVMLTAVFSEETIVRALKGGAVGYILKSELEDIMDVVGLIMAGGAIITPTIAFRVLKTFQGTKNEDDSTKLTNRETQILEELMGGSSTEEVASLLDITVATMRTHVRNIYKKLQVTNKIQLMKKASEMGLI
ncbi:MAG: response regulator transcription factor [Spirochaetia bacterium]|nr:response regulator transcription factor [Spirochaetia bacterium]